MAIGHQEHALAGLTSSSTAVREIPMTDFYALGDVDIKSAISTTGADGRYGLWRSHLPWQPHAISCSEVLSLDNGLELFVYNLNQDRPLILSECQPIDKTTLTFNARGRVKTHLSGKPKGWTDLEGSATLASSHGGRDRWVRFDPDAGNNVVVQISMPPQKFARFAKDSEIEYSSDTLDRLHSNSAQIIDNRTLSPRCELVIDQIASTIVRSNARPQYLMAKMLELLALYADDVAAPGGEAAKEKRIQPAVAARLEKARTLILEDLSRDHTIANLAKAVFLSESTLTHSFRTHFNTSVHAFVVKERLNRARRLLVDDPSRNVSDVAFEVGFKCPSRFASVFLKQFGVLPSAYRASLRN